MITLLVILAIIAALVAIAFWPARVAARKGHSFVHYFICSLVFFPGALLVQGVPHRGRDQRTQDQV